MWLLADRRVNGQGGALVMSTPRKSSLPAGVADVSPDGEETLREALNRKDDPPVTQNIAPPEVFEQRLAKVKAVPNPLLEASRVLLRAQADMPEGFESKDAIVLLRKLLMEEVRVFEKLCEQANIRRDHMIGASYCLCTALDEAATQTAWGREGSSAIEWIQGGLAITFHADLKGGDKVYLLIGRLLEDPDEHRDLLEVIYRILSLGFEGRYRGVTDGKRKHDAIRQRLYNVITSQREPVPLTLSPRWQSTAKGKRLSFTDFPVWISVTVLSVILLGLFGWFKYELFSRSADVQRQIADLARMTTPPAPRPTPPPASPSQIGRAHV